VISAAKLAAQEFREKLEEGLKDEFDELVEAIRDENLPSTPPSVELEIRDTVDFDLGAIN
jgi:predicted house-cleaning noncanonical NTP pyrophosphatase (MazG superfamily)